MSVLALLGGTPAISGKIESYQSIGKDEENAVVDVVRSGCLSGFFGSWQNGFFGGSKVQEFEEAWSKLFNVSYSVSVNSNTSGLYAAMGAVGIGPGDEVIVPPTTMSATAMAPLIYGGVPVFADLDENTFCLSVDSVKACISEKTKAIIVVNLFGQAGPVSELRKLADERGIYLIEDNAQAPLATENGKYCGTIGHIGVFSLNYHKHIHTGEGGMCCTHDERLARRLQMIRNHAEAVAEQAGVDDLTNLVGFNYRMTELSAAIGLVQLKRIEDHVQRRQQLAENLTGAIQGFAGLIAPVVRPGCRHVYYDWILRYNEEETGVSRAVFVKALQAEGFPCFEGYVRPLYFLPIFQKKIAIGSHGFPFPDGGQVYEKGLCPVAERLHEKEILGFETCAWEIGAVKQEELCLALKKVYQNRADLIDYKANG